MRSETRRIRSWDADGADLVSRLHSRRSEIEAAIFARICDPALFGSAGSADAEYIAGLRAAVAAGMEYVFTDIALGEECSGPVPPAMIEQARRAARLGVDLDVLLRRCITGHRLLGEFVAQEAERAGWADHGYVLRLPRRTQETLLESMAAVVASEYARERKRMERSPEQVRRELMQKLLAGEPVDLNAFGYEFDIWHLGLIAKGADAERDVRRLAAGLGCRLLMVSVGGGTIWAWLGSYRKFEIEEIERLLGSGRFADVSLAVGELRRGVDGWRVTHREAQAALSVALLKPKLLTRCVDVAIEAALLRDELTINALVGNYLFPLSSQRDGEVWCETLRVYFAKGCNATKAAAVLGVARHTVERRLHKIEQTLGRPISGCHAELEVALRLKSLGWVAGDDIPRPAGRSL